VHFVARRGLGVSGQGARGRGARAAILSKSPTSLAIALRQMELGGVASFDEALRIEFRIVSRLCRGRDFYEGVRALIIEKDNRPVWSAPPSAAEVDAYFAPLGADELTFPNSGA
jgi:enoyl-CoA hydratase